MTGTLAQFVVVMVIAAGIGAGFEAMRPAGVNTDKPAAAARSAEPSTIFDLAPVVTNLAAPQDIWVRLEGSIIFDPASLPHPEAVAGQVGEDILAYLRTVSLKQIEGPIGLQAIRDDLNERAVTRSNGKVRELVIRTLVVQ
jgi:flagellar FliL protein